MPMNTTGASTEWWGGESTTVLQAVEVLHGKGCQFPSQRGPWRPQWLLLIALALLQSQPPPDLSAVLLMTAILPGYSPLLAPLCCYRFLVKPLNPPRPTFVLRYRIIVFCGRAATVAPSTVLLSPPQ